MLRKYSVLVGLAIFLSACQPSPTFLNSASMISGHEAELYKEVLIEAASIFVFVTGVLLWILIRDRNRGDKSLPPQMHGRATWAIIPIVFIVVLDGMDFIWMLQTMRAVAAPAHAVSDITLRVVGHRWWWELSLPTNCISLSDRRFRFHSNP